MRNYGYTEEGYRRGGSDIRLWKRIGAYCAQAKTGLAAAVVLSLLITVAGLMQPRLMQLAIDTYITSVDLSVVERISGLKRTAFFFGLLICTVFVCSFTQVILLEWIGQTLMQSIRQGLFRHIQTLDMAFFHDQRVGRLVTRLTNDVQNMHEMFTSVMVTLFNDALKLIGIYFFLFFMNRRLALVMTVFIPLAFLITVFFSRLAREIFRAIRSGLAKLNSFLVESFSAISVIQVFNRQRDTDDLYRSLTSAYLKDNLRQVRLFGFFMPLTDLMSSSAVALILWYGGGEILRNRLTLGELVAFLTYMRLFFQPLRELSQKYSIVQSAMASAERIFTLFDTRAGIADRPEAVSGRGLGGDIVFSDVHFGYSADQPVLQGIDLKIREGETVAIVGTTGSGKSTLINLLARFYEPDRGRITVGDKVIDTYALGELRNSIGIIMQDVFILPGTVEDNITLDREPDSEKLRQVLEVTGLNTFIGRLPNGLDTEIGEGKTVLSVGEKQLLSFVRALYRNPRILVLDEATSSIDTESERMLEQATAVSMQGRTSLVIAHRLSTIRRADRIVVMAEGKIVEQGSHEQLMDQDSWYRKLVMMDLQRDR